MGAFETVVGSATVVVDVGGTGFRIGLWSNGQCSLLHTRILEDHERTTEGLVMLIAQETTSLVQEARLSLGQIRGIGIAFAGPIQGTDVVLKAPNLGWHMPVPLAALVSETTGLPCKLVNDANAAALGEWRYGAGQGANNLVYITWSSGIGAGVICNGELISGRGRAGEIGHFIYQPNSAAGIPCGCGKRGCAEAHASGRTIRNHLWTRIGRGRLPQLEEFAAQQGIAEGNVDARTLADAINAGVDGLQDVANEFAEVFGVVLANVVYAYDPELVVIGGGVAKSWSVYVMPAIQSLVGRVMEGSFLPVIVPATLEETSGLAGAASLFDPIEE